MSLADVSTEELLVCRMTLAELMDDFVRRHPSDRDKECVKRMKTSFKSCRDLWDRRYNEINCFDMQNHIDDLGNHLHAKRRMKAFFKNLDLLARELHIPGERQSPWLEKIKDDPDAPRMLRHRFRTDEVEAILAHGDVQDMYLAWLLLYTAYRAGELITRRKSDVDLDEWIIHGGIKTRAGYERRVPVHPRIRPIVARLMQTPGEYLVCDSCGKAMTEEELLFRVRMATLPYLHDKHIDHEFRRTTYTRFIETGGNPMIAEVILGHELPNRSDEFYLDCSPEFLNEYAIQHLWK